MNSIICYSDGACRNNGRTNAKGSIGVSIVKNGKEILTHSEYLGIIVNLGPIISSEKDINVVVTNNVTEYLAFIKGIKMLIDANEINEVDKVEFKVDSKLVCEQMNGRWKVKHPVLIKLYNYAIELLKKFHNYKVSHVLRHYNKRADELANMAFN